MERSERLRYIDAIDTLHAVRREISALQDSAQSAVDALPAHDPLAQGLRYAVIQLGDAWKSIDEAIVCTESALMRVVPSA
jgi:hypothetical protein